MRYNTDYEIDEKVYIIQTTFNNFKKPCNFCDNGKIICKNNKTVECPKCNGRGYKTSNKITYIVLDNAEILEIKIYIDKISININYVVCINSVSMVVLEKNIFKTKKAAQKECDKRNKQKRNIK